MDILNTNLPLRKRLENRKAGKEYANKLSTMWEGFNGEGANRVRVVGFNTMKEARGMWRNVQYADECARLDHKGWFTDIHCDGSLRGVVAQLPARNKETIFLSGYEETDGGMVVFFLEQFGTAEEAARNADSEAQRLAEKERDYRAEEAYKMRIADLKDENKQARQKIKELRKEISAVAKCGHKLATKELRGNVASLLASIEDNKAKLAKLERDGYDADYY